MREPTNTAGGQRGGRAFCEECLTYGAERFLLRVCLSCGHIGCAEGTPCDHAAAHYAETDHPIAAAVGSLAPRWSYPDERPI
jgi:uncharacterized UBP type Zn finger protein